MTEMDSHQVIKRPLHTEKSVADIRNHNRYHFEVDAKARKNDVRKAIEELFPGVKVVAVNTLWMRGKERRVRWVRGRTKDWKKALVTLRPNDTIDIGY
jgi:large subunit ribosomal protein L23